MLDAAMRSLAAFLRKIWSNTCCQGIDERKALRKKGKYHDGAVSDLALIDCHQRSWTLTSCQPPSGLMRSANQNKAFHEPMEVLAITLTFARAFFSSK